MNKVTLNIGGMSCGMCEAHINDVVRSIYPKAKKVSSSFKKGETTFLIDGEPDFEKLRDAVVKTGYDFNGGSFAPLRKEGTVRSIGSRRASAVQD